MTHVGALDKMAVRDMSPWVGERGLFAPALLVARPALTGFVPFTRLIVSTTSCESAQGREGLMSFQRRARASDPRLKVDELERVLEQEEFGGSRPPQTLAPTGWKTNT